MACSGTALFTLLFLIRTYLNYYTTINPRLNEIFRKIISCKRLIVAKDKDEERTVHPAWSQTDFVVPLTLIFTVGHSFEKFGKKLHDHRSVVQGYVMSHDCNTRGQRIEGTWK
jgi:hypothetical protein